MTGSRKTKLAATIGFLLIALVVIGGMTWATIATLELAKRNVREEYDRKVSLALGRMESYTRAIINAETFRDYFDYLALHVREPLIVYRQDEEFHADQVLLESPIAESGPPHEWIDLYFNVLPDGQVTSPQVPDEAWRWTIRAFLLPEAMAQRARATMEWAETLLPKVNLSHCVEHSLARAIGVPGLCCGDAGIKLTDEELERYLPTSLCESRRILMKNMNIQGVPLPAAADLDDDSTETVEVTVGPIAPAFWLAAPPEAGRKLAFVRECRAGTELFHQGFIGDWNTLKPILLNMISDLFSEAEFEALADDATLAPDLEKLRLINLPVRLSIPDEVGELEQRASRNVRGVLIAAWLAAMIVLAVAGWGVRNLVALTERRMQFAYAVTHELRTPLTTFRLYSDMLSAGLVPEASREEYLQTLNQESIRLSSLVEGVLEYARLENHKAKLNPVETNAEALLQHIKESLEARCHQFDVEPRTLNGLPKDEQLRVDVDVINRICGVLINNACRHTRGVDKPVVLVNLARVDGSLQLDVIDSGSGIERGDARKIFKPFRRGRKAESTAQGGIGLGLALARCWADLLGGRLELAARHHAEYGGAHFRLTIPTHMNA